MEIRDLLPPENGRLFVTGSSGDGKSTLVRRLDQCVPPNEFVIALDSKGEWPIRPRFGKSDIPWRRLPRGVPLSMLEPGHYVYRTSYPDMADRNVEKIIKWALKHKHVTIIIDEINNFSHGGYTLPIISKLLREGRSKFCRVIAGSQFPVKVAEEVKSQATMLIVFIIPNKTHRKLLADNFHPGLINEPDGEFSFFVWRKKERGKLLHVKQEAFKDRRFFDQSEQDKLKDAKRRKRSGE